MALGKNVEALRKRNGWTMEDLSVRSGVEVGTINALEKRDSKRSQYATALARAFGLSVEELESGAAAPPPALHEPSNVSTALLGSRRIPLISYVQAGHMSEAIDPYQVGDAADWLLTDLELSANAFALRIKGDSMLPDFREGDTVVIDPAVEPIPGDYVVAKNGENEATFKKYRPRGVNERGDTVFELVPLNEDYPSMRSDITPIRIIGTMVEHRRYRKR